MKRIPVILFFIVFALGFTLYTLFTRPSDLPDLMRYFLHGDDYDNQ